MRATVDSVISQLASLESDVNNTTLDNSTKAATDKIINTEENDILQQALKNSGLPNKNEVTPKGYCLMEIFFISFQISYIY